MGHHVYCFLGIDCDRKEECDPERSLRYKWFGTYYILVAFISAPLLLFAFSFTIDLGVGGIILNIVLDALVIVAVLLAIFKIEVVAKLLKLPGGPEELPSAEKD